MKVTQQQVEQFRTEGFCAVERFFDEHEVAAMQAEAARWQREGLLNNVRTEGDGQTASKQKVNLQICPLNPHSPLFRAMPFEPRVTETIAALIGDDFVLHLDQTFLKPARHGMGTNWHQDNAYFQIRNPLHGTAMWIAVHDATVANGTIRVIPRAFDEKLEHSRDPESNHHIRCYPDESKAVPIEVPAGGAAFFCYGTPHATGANNTDRDRCGVAFHFIHRDAMNDNPEGNPPLGTELIEPHTTGGMAEYGCKVAGTWADEVDRLRSATAAAKYQSQGSKVKNA